MKKNRTAYLSLGTNLGDRFGNLQTAVNLLFNRVGKIEQMASIYKTPAWGFEGEDFLNTCLSVKTRLSAEELLKTILTIEKEIGRERKQNAAYENRPIDIDILFFEDEVLETEILTLPHPQLQERKFVLIPLAEIASTVIHPKFNKSVKALAEECKDDSSIERLPQKLNTPKFESTSINYLAIEGNIGAGKTSLATMMAEDFNAKLVLERFKDNPFLPKFYKNKERYAFPLEMSFLADRYQQLLDDIANHDLFNEMMVADYDIYKSMIFAQVTLPEEEFNLYQKLFRIMYREIPKPDLYIYLYQNTERLLENIKKRGRSYEQEIPVSYLEKLNQGYFNFIKTQHHLEVKIIDVSAYDFVENRSDYIKVLEKIFN